MRLTRAEREFKGCCPFHKEKTPSFYVNDDKQFFHCFGCGAHGDAIDYLKKRGLREDTIAAFRLGSAPADGQALRRHVEEHDDMT